MTILRRAAPALAALALLAIAAGGHAPSGLAAPGRAVILGATPDLAADTLTIHGRDLAPGGEAPEVTLGGVALGVASATDDTVVAELPPGVAGRNHLLVVGSGNRSASAAVWIPGEGIVTRAGIRIESTESDVRVIAGSSRITVDPAGGIRIQASGPLALDSAGALTLRGSSVRIDSATTLRLGAAAAIDVVSSGTANVSAAGTVNVTGALIRLN